MDIGNETWNADAVEMIGMRSCDGWPVAGAVPEIETARYFEQDYAGARVGARRKAGPFADAPSGTVKIPIDPRER